jgi:hypothetical protein
MAVAAEENESRPRTGRYSWFIVSFSIIYEPGTASFFHRSTNQTLMGKFGSLELHVILSASQVRHSILFYKYLQIRWSCKIEAKFFVFLKYVQTFILKKFDENTIKIWVVSGYCRDLGG